MAGECWWFFEISGDSAPDCSSGHSLWQEYREINLNMEMASLRMPKFGVLQSLFFQTNPYWWVIYTYIYIYIYIYTHILLIAFCDPMLGGAVGIIRKNSYGVAPQFSPCNYGFTSTKILGLCGCKPIVYITKIACINGLVQGKILTGNHRYFPIKYGAFLLFFPLNQSIACNPLPSADPSPSKQASFGKSAARLTAECSSGIAAFHSVPGLHRRTADFNMMIATEMGP